MDHITSRDGTTIGFVRSGAGPPLLLVHGTTADHTRWAGYGIRREGRPVLNNLPGHRAVEYSDTAAPTYTQKTAPPRRMKAIVYTEYGPPDVLQLKEVEQPAPEDDQVLIRVRATTVSAADYRARALNVPPGFRLLSRFFFGFTRPKKTILGTVLAGTVEAAGAKVTRFKEGDRVFGSTGAGFGAYAEYVCLPEDGVLAAIPPGMTFEEAAAVPFGALAALYFLRDLGQIRSGQRILINGASGAVGTAAVQLANYYGADVTGVCSTANVDLVRSLGADRVIDYTKEDFTRNGETYDLILETVGKVPFARCKGSLNEKGLYLFVSGGLPDFMQMLRTSWSGGPKAVGGVTPQRTEDLLFLRELMEAGRLKPVIGRRYPLEQAAEAHRYADTGHKKGAVVLTLEPNGVSL